MGAIEELASYADVEGLDWERLNAAGEGILGSGGYLTQLQKQWERFHAVTQTLAISDAEWEETTAAEAAGAWKEMRAHIGDKADLMLEALSNGKLRVAWDHAATIYTGSLKKLVIAASAVSHRNMVAHEDGTLVFAVQTEQSTLQEAEADADHIVMVWQAIGKLDQWGALNELKKSEFAPMGAAPAAAAAARGLPIAIAAIGIAAAIAAVLVFLAYLSHRNELLETYCFDDDGNVRPKAPAWCEKAGDALMSDPLSVFLQPIKASGKTLATGLSITAGVAAVLWLAPMVLRRFRDAARKK